MNRKSRRWQDDPEFLSNLTFTIQILTAVIPSVLLVIALVMALAEN